MIGGLAPQRIRVAMFREKSRAAFGLADGGAPSESATHGLPPRRRGISGASVYWLAQTMRAIHTMSVRSITRVS